MAEKKINDHMRRFLHPKALKLFFTLVLSIFIFQSAISQDAAASGEIPTDEELANYVNGVWDTGQSNYIKL